MTDTKKAAALLEQEQSQTKKPEISIPNEAPAVKAQITDLASLRVEVSSIGYKKEIGRAVKGRVEICEANTTRP